MSVPAQLVLRDGEVVLRPRTTEDVATSGLRRDQQDQQQVEQQVKQVGQQVEQVEQVEQVVRFLIEHRSRVAGSGAVRLMGDGIGELSWAVSPEHWGQGIGTRAVKLMVRYAFEELGLHRVAAYTDPDDRASLRIAGRAGLRREGFLRGARGAGSATEPGADQPGATEQNAEPNAEQNATGRGGERRDYVQLARLATDPEPTSGGGFIAVLNAGLPTKRVIAQGLIRNDANEILMCELTYKQEWDLPGGVVDPHESPAHAIVREVNEEMQVEVAPLSLLAVNWLPAWHGWDDAVLFVFDLGVDDDVIARAHLEPREVRALHWCTPERVERHAAPYVTRLLSRLAQQTDGTAYLEDGADPGT